MQSGRRKALKSFVLHIRFRIGLRPQPALRARTRYDAVEAAELDEPQAMQALIALKLSANAQFQDRPGAYKLIEAAISRGDQTMAQRLADCRAN
jgi:hypothetical protein